MGIGMIKSRLSKINKALPGLLLGIIAFGVICQIVGLFLVKDKADYSIGLWIGVLTAIFMAFHMAVCLNNSVLLNEKGAQASVTRQSIFRYVIVIAVELVLVYTRLGNPLSGFLGIMGLKVSAYIQPLLSRLTHHEQFSQDGTGNQEN
jgi:energy-converting hydrogenase Eha subunit A